MTAYEMRISDWSSDVCSSDLLAHALCKQDLADAVVDLVRAGVVQVLALQIDLCPAQRFGQARREIERAFAADELLEQIVNFRLERRVGRGGAIFPLKVQDPRHQRFRDIAAAELRSEEHTSALQSLMRLSYAAYLLKKTNITHTIT